MGQWLNVETSDSSVVSTAFLRVAVNYTGDSDGRVPKYSIPNNPKALLYRLTQGGDREINKDIPSKFFLRPEMRD